MEDESPKEVLVDVDLEGRILNGKGITVIGNELDFSVSLMRIPHIMETEGLFEIDDTRYCLKGKEYDPEEPVKCVITGVEGFVYSGDPPETIRVFNSLFERREGKSAEPAPEPAPEPTPEPAVEPPTEQEYEKTEMAEEQPQQAEDSVEETPEEGREQAQEEASGLEQELEETKQTVQNLEAQLKEKDEAFAEERDNFEARLKELEDAVKAHDASMEEKGSEIAQHKENLKEAEEKISNLENELSEAKKEDQEYKEKAEKAEESYEKIQADLENVTAQKDDLSKKTESLEKEMEELANENIKLEQQAQPLLDDVRTLSAAKEEAEKKLGEFEEKSREEIEKDEKRVNKSTKELHDAIKKLTQFDLMAMELLDAGQDVPFEDKLSKVKQSIIDKANLKQVFISLKEEGKISEDETPDEALPDDHLDLKRAATYVMVNIFHKAAGNLDSAEETIGTILNSFQSIDPAEFGLPEKDVKILGEFLIMELKNSSHADSADYGAFISTVLEHQVKPLLSELSEPLDRTKKLKELESFYEKYTPKES